MSAEGTLVALWLLAAVGTAGLLLLVAAYVAGRARAESPDPRSADPDFV